MESTDTIEAGPKRSRIYYELALNQRQEDWEFRDEAAALLSWIKRFNDEFKLSITELALRVDNLPVHIYGHFREGHNGQGLRGEIAINLRPMAHRPFGLTLASLLHQVLHAWQWEHGRPAVKGGHNREYRGKAKEVGLLVTKDGQTGFMPGGPFEQLIGSCGFKLPESVASPPIRSQRPVGNSKLKKWSCGCTTARVAVADFQARCLKCGSLFVCLDGPAQSSAAVPPRVDG
jgi:hypothetical protein